MFLGIRRPALLTGLEHVFFPAVGLELFDILSVISLVRPSCKKFKVLAIGTLFGPHG